jgi:hypothetical protein
LCEHLAVINQLSEQSVHEGAKIPTEIEVVIMQNHPALVTGLAALAGKKLISACSSLKNFSMEFESGLGLRIDASMDEDEPVLSAIVVEAHTLPKASDAVCSVDWTWIYGSNIKKYGVSSNFVKFELDGIGPLTVSAGVWKAEPFLSFQPFKAPPKA